MCEEAALADADLCGKWKVQLIAEGHRYIVRRASDGAPVDTRGLVSVTAFAETLFQDFDGPRVVAAMKPARRMAKYGGMSDGQILAQWEHKKKRAATLGTAMHAYIEDYLRGLMRGEPRRLVPRCPPPEPDEPDSSGTVIRVPAFIAFAKTLARRRLFPVAVEKCVYDEELQMAGTVDAVFRDEKDGGFLIFDWKRRPEYTRDSPFPGGKAETPAAGLPCCHHSKAIVQLNLYRGILKRAGFCDAKALRIVTLHPDLPEDFREDDVPLDDGLFGAILDFRRRALAEQS